MTKLVRIDGGKQDPKTKLGTTGGLDDGFWALRFVTIMVIGFVPAIVGLVLGMAYHWGWFFLAAPFVGGIACLIAVLVIVSFVDLWNEAWRTPRDG